MQKFVEVVLKKLLNGYSVTDFCLLWMYLTCTISKLNTILDNYI